MIKKLLEFEFQGNNGAGYRHWHHNQKFIEVVITENIQAKTFEVSIHPNTDKGYRDPFEIEIFDSLEKCIEFATKYLIQAG